MNQKNTRLQNVRNLVSEEGSLAAFAERIERTPAQASMIAGKNPQRGIGDKIARHIEVCFNKPEGWLDETHSLDPLEIQAEKVKQAYKDASRESRLLIERMFGILQDHELKDQDRS
jgi:hypothetical protein